MFKLLDVLFGCTHKRYTFPISTRPGQRRSQAAMVTGTYVVCLECGREFPYDWRQMKVISSPVERPAALAEPAEAVKRAA
ncbi:MAG: hypothetical protein ACE14L_17365 [Terriglobales bacterium]